MSYKLSWAAKVLLAFALTYIFLTSISCARMFACTTEVTYIVRPDKTVEGSYSSCKEQTAFKADIDPSTGKATIESDKSSTQESVIAASLTLILNMMNRLLPLIEKAAAVSGS